MLARTNEPTQLTSVRTNSKVVIPAHSSNSLTHLVKSDKIDTPIGIQLFGYCFHFKSEQARRNYHKALVLFLTFLAYAAFHMGRRPLTVVKNVLNRSCSKPATNNLTDTTSLLTQDTKNCDWAPFDDDTTANQLLAYLDTAFLSSYAIFMFVSGIVAERMSLRYLIAVGSILTGLGLIAFGLAYHFEIHSFSYFLTVQLISGALQSIGWPVVVTCISNWFDESKRGTIYGLWNSHTSIGNMLGATIAGYYVERDWGLSFIVPGGLMIFVGILLYLFLVPSPQDIGLSPLPIAEREDSINGATSNQPGSQQQKTAANLEIETSKDFKATMTIVDEIDEQPRAISFFKALKIPGVIEYSFCLFFSKLVSYTFLYWLPRYITSSTKFDSEDSAYLSTPFDVGGIAGAIVAGYLSDRLKVNGIICNIMLILAIPSMFIYQRYGAYSPMHNILLQLIVGGLVNGPYCLITTAVSADLGNRIKDGRAMATVSAIIDGMGSIGAVLGPLFAGLVSSNDWQSVFLMLMLADVLASLCIARVTVQDFKGRFKEESSHGEVGP